MTINKEHVFSLEQIHLVTRCIRQAIQDEKNGVVHLDTGMFIVQYPEKWCCCGHTQSSHHTEKENNSCISCYCKGFDESSGSAACFGSHNTALEHRISLEKERFRILRNFTQSVVDDKCEQGCSSHNSTGILRVECNCIAAIAKIALSKAARAKV